MINCCPCHFQMLKPDTTGIVQSVLVRVILAQFAWDVRMNTEIKECVNAINEKCKELGYTLDGMATCGV